MSQAHWKTYKTLGDIGEIKVDSTGAYPPEAEVYEEFEEDGRVYFDLYRVPLEKFYLKKGKIVDKHGHEEWFSKDLDEVARSAGTTKAKLARALCGRDIVKRFRAYHNIAGYYGWNNFDSYPLRLTEKEREKRERGPTARRIHTQRYGWSRPGSRKRRR